MVRGSLRCAGFNNVDLSAAARLLDFPDVLVTGHQAFFTREAMEQIAATTLSNIAEIESGADCQNTVPVNLFRETGAKSLDE